MPATADHPEVLVWTDADRADIVQQVLGRMSELKVLAVGSPRPGARLVELAESFSAASFDDLRQMIVQLPAQYLFLATTSAVKADDIAAAIQQQIDVLSLEPLLETGKLFNDAKSRSIAAEHIYLLPRFRQCPAYLAAADPQQALGTIRAMQVVSVGPASVASLSARLCDAVDMVMSHRGLPDMVDAAWVGPTPDASQNLRGLVGHLTAHLRFSDQASAAVLVSDQSPLHHRAATVVGSTGTLLLEDWAYQLIGRDEQSQPMVIDQLATTDEAAFGDAAALIAHQWRWLLTHRIADAGQRVDPRALLAVAETALLAARTGQPESPLKLLEMSGIIGK